MAGNAKEATDPLVLLGKILLGRYRIQDRLAQGGMSVLYRSRDERLQRPVCVKVFFGLNPSMAVYQTSYEHFVQEAFALSQLQHPNTIRIYDFGYLEEEPKSPFHVSELMEGGTLRNLVQRQGPLDVAGALEILEPLVGALAEAHTHGIVHRDIKPTNILFGQAGNRRIVKLADFGIAKAHVDEFERAIPNRAKDTQAIPGRRISLYSPGWAAPEQLRGRDVEPTADVFALGLVVAFMLSGKKLFSDRDVHRTIEDRQQGDRYVERALEAMKLPEGVAEVLARACRVAPPERFPGVDELLIALRALKPSGAAAASGDEPTDERDPTKERPQRPPLTDAELATIPSIARVSEPVVRATLPGTGVAQAQAATPTLADPGAGPAAPALAAAAAAAADAAPAEVLLSNLYGNETIAGGRRVRLVPAHEQVDFETLLDNRVRMRFRLTLLPDSAAGPRFHLKGLNCFVAKPGARPTGAVDLGEDGRIDVLSPDRTRLDRVQCGLGQTRGNSRLFSLGGATLAVPLAEAPRAVLLDFGPGRDLVLVYRARTSAKRGAS